MSLFPFQMKEVEVAEGTKQYLGLAAIEQNKAAAARCNGDGHLSVEKATGSRVSGAPPTRRLCALNTYGLVDC